MYSGARKLIAAPSAAGARRRAGRRPRRIRACRRSNSASSSGRSVVQSTKSTPRSRHSSLDLAPRGRANRSQVLRPRRARDRRTARGPIPRRGTCRASSNANVDLGRVEHAQHDHVVPPRAQVAELASAARRRRPAGRRSARPARACAPSAAICSSGSARSVARPRGSRSQQRHQPPQVPGPMPRRQVLGDLARRT